MGTYWRRLTFSQTGEEAWRYTGRSGERCEQMRFERRLGLSRFAVLHLAGTQDLLEVLTNALLGALSTVSLRSWDESSCQGLSIARETGHEVRNELCSGVDWSRGEAGFLVREYLRRASEEAPDVIDEEMDIDRFSHLFWETVEDTSVGVTSGGESEVFYLLRARLIERSVYGTAVALAPLMHLLDPPCAPLGRVAQLSWLVTCALRGGEPIGLEELRLRLTGMGFECQAEFLRFCILNDPTLLLIEQENDERCSAVDLCEEVFPSFDVAAFGISPTRYVQAKNNFGWQRNDGDVTVCAEEIVAFFKCRGEDRYISRVDPEELAVKILLRSTAGTAEIQGWPEAVHGAVVAALLKAGRALRLGELRRLTGLEELTVTPQRLPPGRVLAYAPSKRFLERETAYYVLEDWVETKERKKGRIFADRIITPRRRKEIRISDDVVWGQLEQDEVYKAFGVVSAERLAGRLAERLPGRPTEMYYLLKIQDRVEEILSAAFVRVGKGYFVKEGVGPIREEGSTASRWRREILVFVLGEPEDLHAALDALPGEYSTTLRGMM